MPITSSVEGDIVKLALEGKYSAIVHGCNCLSVFGAGLAPQIKKAWPEAYEADKNYRLNKMDRLGSYSYWTTEEGLIIINAYTQGGHTLIKGVPNLDYQAVASVFELLNLNIYNMQEGDKKIGIPLIGAGLAGGHWDAISTIINLVTPNLDIELVVYNPNPDTTED